MAVNYFGNIALTLALLPSMRARKAGIIATVSSIAGKFGTPMRTGYSASKFATNGFYEALRADEIFCTATTYALVHAKSFEGQTLGDGSPGPVFTRLVEAWKKLARVDFVAQAQDYAQRLPAWEQAALSALGRKETP